MWLSNPLITSVPCTNGQINQALAGQGQQQPGITLRRVRPGVNVTANVLNVFRGPPDKGLENFEGSPGEGRGAEVVFEPTALPVEGIVFQPHETQKPVRAVIPGGRHYAHAVGQKLIIGVIPGRPENPSG